jgi:hypothetical protein
MIESPMLVRILAKASQRAILTILEARFGTVSKDVARRIRQILDEKTFRQLIRVAVTSNDLDTFRSALLKRGPRVKRRRCLKK